MRKLRIVLCAVLCVMCLFFALSCGNDEPVTLQAPVLSFDSNTGVVSWGAVEGATGYEYRINDGQSLYVGKDTTKITLLKSESVSVRALGDGEKYLDSEWSEKVASSLSSQLATPSLKLTAMGNQVLVSWEIDKNATSYEYRINSGAITPIEGEIGSFLVNKGDYFYLHALGNGTTFTNSEWAMVKCEP